MLSHSILTQTALASELASTSLIKPKGERWKRVLAADLLLTALIDAFSILVIFLLMSFSSTGDILQMGKNMELPKAGLADVIERNTIVKLDDTKVYLEDKLVNAETLIQGLIDIRKSFAETHPNEEFSGKLTVQADRRTKYEELNQIVLAAAHAGFSDIRFAVLLK